MSSVSSVYFAAQMTGSGLLPFTEQKQTLVLSALAQVFQVGR